MLFYLDDSLVFCSMGPRQGSDGNGFLNPLGVRHVMILACFAIASEKNEKK
jgi:hypothetical protein